MVKTKMKKDKIFDLLRYRIFSYYKEAIEIRSGGMPKPRVVIYHPTYICNHNCPGCDFRKQNKEYRMALSRENATRVIDQIICFGIEGIEFAGGGEPLMYPYIVEDVTRLHNAGVAVSLITNGSYLEGKVLETFIKYGNYIRISLEAGTKEVFNKVKGLKSSGEFDKIIGNIKKTAELRNRINKNLDISLKFTVGRFNHHDMENAIRLAIILKVDSIQFKLYENVDNIEVHKEGDGYLQHGIDDVQKKLIALKMTYGDKIRILGNLQKTKMKCSCWLNPIYSVIDAFGDIYICSYYRHRMNEHKLGSLLKNTYEEIWFSAEHMKRLKKIKKSDCNKYDCRFHIYNDVMNEIMSSEKNYLKFI